jgi:hypothetical protein
MLVTRTRISPLAPGRRDGDLTDGLLVGDQPLQLPQLPDALLRRGFTALPRPNGREPQ